MAKQKVVEVKGIKLTVFGRWEPMSDVSLKALQQAVGGYITVVNIDGGGVVAIDDVFDLPIRLLNKPVKDLFGLDIVGDVVIIGNPDDEGETLPISNELIAKIVLNVPVTPQVYKKLNKMPRIMEVITNAALGTADVP